eukprot:1158457-Pelagomonas_calceolata.AAC.3
MQQGMACVGVTNAKAGHAHMSMQQGMACVSVTNAKAGHAFDHVHTGAEHAAIVDSKVTALSASGASLLPKRSTKRPTELPQMLYPVSPSTCAGTPKVVVTPDLRKHVNDGAHAEQPGGYKHKASSVTSQTQGQ